MSAHGPQISSTPMLPIALSIEERQEQIQIEFTVISGCIALVACAALSLVTYLGLSLATVALLLSWKQWTELNPPAREELDSPTKALIATTIVGIGFFFLQLNPLSQVILCTALGAGLAAVFIHECIFNAQATLNAALKEACQQSQLDDVKALLAKKACVFARDDNGNTPFHHAIQNNAASADILKELQAHLDITPTTLKDVFLSAKNLISDEVTQKWQHCYQQIKQCISSNSRQNRAAVYDALYQVATSYDAPFKIMVNALARFLRERVNSAYGKNAKNNEGKNPLDLITPDFDKSHRDAISLCLNPDYIPANEPSLPQTTEQSPSQPLRFSAQTKQGEKKALTKTQEKTTKKRTVNKR